MVLVLVRDNAGVDISARTEYAIRAMLALAQAATEPRSAERGHARHPQDLPRRFLESIVFDPRRAGLVVSTRGAQGGYRLPETRTEVSLGDVFRAVDGPLAEVRGLRPHETRYDGVAEHLPTVWVAVRASLRQVLDETSLADVLSGESPDRVLELSSAPDAWRNR